MGAGATGILLRRERLGGAARKKSALEAEEPQVSELRAGTDAGGTKDATARFGEKLFV